MSKYGTKEIKLDEPKVSKWLPTGTCQIAKITEIEFFTTPKGTPGMKTTLTGKPMEELNGEGQRLEDTRWLSDAAVPYTKKFMVAISEAAGVREEFDTKSEEVTSDEDFVTMFKSLVLNKPLAWTIGGEEVELTNDEGDVNIWMKPVLPAYNFVAPVSELASLNEKREKAEDKIFKRLEKTETTTATTVTNSDGSTEEVDW